MAESKKPAASADSKTDSVKGILKEDSEFVGNKKNKSSTRKSAKWDEMNIIATLHPADKTYGTLKIDEPPTPFARDSTGVNPDDLASRLQSMNLSKPKTKEADANIDLSVKNKPFEEKRKAHYDEYLSMQKARELMEKEDEKNKTKKEDAAKK